MLGKHLPMASIAVVSSSFFLGLAVLGWGGFGAFFAHPPFIAVLVVFVLLLGAAMLTQGNLNPGEREDRGNRWIIWAIMGLSLVLPMCRPIPTGSASGPWMARQCAGSASRLARSAACS